MNGNFSYLFNTKIIFGNDSLDYLNNELKDYKNILICHNHSSTKNNILDLVIKNLVDKNIKTFEVPSSNPEYHSVYTAKTMIISDSTFEPDFILSVGGGSVHDFSKALALFLENPLDDIWTKYFLCKSLQKDRPQTTNPPLPVGCIDTTFGSGSEVNSSIVLSDYANNLKIETIFDESYRPYFAMVIPSWIGYIPKDKIVPSIFDIVCHTIEQYMSNSDICVSDYFALAILDNIQNCLQSFKRFGFIDYENNISDLVWDSLYACNSLLSKGKTPDWGLHSIAEKLTAHEGITHGLTLAYYARRYYNELSKLKNKNLRTRFEMFKNHFGYSVDEYLKKVLTNLEMSKYINTKIKIQADYDKIYKELIKDIGNIGFVSEIKDLRKFLEG